MAFLICTCFVKVFTTFTIVRIGLGMRGGGFGLVIAAVSFALSIFIMTPQLDRIGGVDSLISGKVAAPMEQFRPFLEKHVDISIRDRLSQASQPASGPTSINLLSATFLIEELQSAFELGFIILIPLVVLDIIVANVIAVLGITQLSHEVVALPLKILAFVTLNGWLLISEKLIRAYA